MKEFLETVVKYITQLFNAIIKTGHFPSQLKVAQTILIQKPGKPPDEVKSYRSISRLSAVSKLRKTIPEKTQTYSRRKTPF